MTRFTVSLFVRLALVSQGMTAKRSNEGEAYPL